jgi:hypothetical protein
MSETENDLSQELQRAMKAVIEAQKALLRGKTRARTEKLRLDTEVAQLKEALVNAEQVVDDIRQRLMDYQLGET